MSEITRATENEGEFGVRPNSSPVTTRQTDEVGRIQRGMSKAYINQTIVSRARKLVLSDVCTLSETEDQPLHIAETPIYTFVLPNINIYPDGFKAFLYKELIEMPTLVALEQGGFLNWWADLGIGPRLYPMQTSGDGNCLLHAASLAMWGFHDRQLVLRKLLAANMAGGVATDAFRRRWRWQQTCTNKQCGLVYAEDEWEREWQYIVKLASWQPKPQSDGNSTIPISRSHAGSLSDSEAVFESLEELHVFILAHVLRRPIIVIAKSVLTNADGEPLAPIPFGGIYLPLECPPSDCHRSPLLLTYDAAHFCALVRMESDVAELAIPLVSPDLDLLPVHFATDPGPCYDWQREDPSDHELTTDDKLRLLEAYMDVKLTATSALDMRAELFDRVMRSHHRASLDLAAAQAAAEAVRKPAGSAAGSIAKTFGSLGHAVSQKLRHIGGKAAQKGSVGTATQSSRTSTRAVRMIADRQQIPCATLSQRRMFHHDDLVRNYVTQAAQRYGDVRRRARRQSDELVSVLSPTRAAPPVNQLTTSATAQFERRNTLLLTGKSKFYTMSYEDHCQTPPPLTSSQSLSLFPPPSRNEADSAQDIIVNPSAEVLTGRKPTEPSGRPAGSPQLVQSGTKLSSSRPYSDPNHNSIFWPCDLAPHCLGAPNCPNPVQPHTGSLCAACFQARRYSSVVRYPTSTTKL